MGLDEMSYSTKCLSDQMSFRRNVMDLTGLCRGRIIDAVLLLAEKLCVNVLLIRFCAYIRFFVQVFVLKRL